MPLLRNPPLFMQTHLIRWPVKRPEHTNTQWFLAGAEAFALKSSEASENGDTDTLTWLT
jgi:hypothetical protein